MAKRVHNKHPKKEPPKHEDYSEEEESPSDWHLLDRYVQELAERRKAKGLPPQPTNLTEEEQKARHDARMKKVREEEEERRRKMDEDDERWQKETAERRAENNKKKMEKWKEDWTAEQNKNKESDSDVTDITTDD
jgi:hypothetical protein